MSSNASSTNTNPASKALPMKLAKLDADERFAVIGEPWMKYKRVRGPNKPKPRVANALKGKPRPSRKKRRTAPPPCPPMSSSSFETRRPNPELTTQRTLEQTSHLDTLTVPSIDRCPSSSSWVTDESDFGEPFPNNLINWKHWTHIESYMCPPSDAEPPSLNTTTISRPIGQGPTPSPLPLAYDARFFSYPNVAAPYPQVASTSQPQIMMAYGTQYDNTTIPYHPHVSSDISRGSFDPYAPQNSMPVNASASMHHIPDVHTSADVDGYYQWPAEYQADFASGSGSQPSSN